MQDLGAKDIYTRILSDLQDLNISDSLTTMMSQDACEILKKEIHMTLGHNYDEHISSRNYEIFKVRYDGIEFSGEFMNVYTLLYLELLNEESKIPANELVNKWEYSFQLSPYGAWAMLKRIGKAVEYDRREHELLLPIPLNEIKRNPNLRQNPGYDSDYYL